MISVLLEQNGLRVHLAGSDRFLTWPEPSEILLPSDAVASAVSYPDLDSVPEWKQIQWSWGRGFRTLPVVPGHWVFGRRRIGTERLFFALRGPTIPVLRVTAHEWELDGVMVSTPEATALAAAFDRL